ncbi:ras-responsive element-binding protein 1-like isoform X2 [Anneissia japonica]|uniref:ras-responsive element-binding protein 1-like isoform X2 n=1 Tax=Anneissia japonica TaxID=1529436 RepID=UPI0014257736|nr:ras-responsive element-binding protein 1-like isoform X2 [Anneissia japonica]
MVMFKRYSLRSDDELEEGTDDDKFKGKQIKMNKSARSRKRKQMLIRKQQKQCINIYEELTNGQNIAQNETTTLIDLSYKQEGIGNKEDKDSDDGSMTNENGKLENSVFHCADDADDFEIDSNNSSSKDGEQNEFNDEANFQNHVTSLFNQPPMKRRKPMRMPYSEPKDLTCQVCGDVLPNATELTVHIRQHNIPSNSNNHSCNMCGRILSSQSSLDRHMLVHSGERPFKCPICKMAFTTNGNMNRHLRTHEKENEAVAETSIFDVTLQTNRQRKRIPSKRLLECDEDYMPIKKKLAPKSPIKKTKPIIPLPRETVEISLQTEDLNCPVCHKAFLCKYGVLTHMEMHPHMSLRCSICSAVFKNHKGLRMHIQMVHEKVMKQTASSVPVGFQDLACLHVDFSSNSFPRVAQKWCEDNARRCGSARIKFVCKVCNKAFPCRAALELHENTHDDNMTDIQQQPCDTMHKMLEAPRDQNQFLALFSLQPTSGSTKEYKAKAFIGNPAPSPRKSTNVSNSFIQSSPRKKPLQWHNLSKDSMKMASTVPKKVSPYIYPIRSMTLLTQPNMIKRSPAKGSAISTGSVQTLPVYKMAPSPPPSLQKIKVKIEQSKDEIQVMDLSPNMTASTGDEGSAMEPEGNPEEAGSERLVMSDPADPSASNVDKKFLHTCKYCNKVFPFASTLKIHMRNHMGLTPYQCMLCTYASADKSTLVRHMRTHSGERPFSCGICEFPFTTKANCERHIRKKHNKDDKADIESCIISNENPKLVETTLFTAPESVCSICGRNFKFFRDLQNHMRVHEKCDDKPYICSRCPSGFASRSNCMRHIAKRHPEVQPEDVENVMIIQEPSKPTSKSDPPIEDAFEQPLDFSMKADKPAMIALASASQLLANSAGSDAQRKQFPKLLIPHSSIGKLRFKRVYHKFYSRAVDALVCPHCDLAFSRSTLFKRHIRSHTAERPFRCYFCSAAFTVKENLDKHMVKRHNNIADGSQQSFIPKVATPMQHKLLSKTPSKRPSKTRLKPSTRQWVDLTNSTNNDVPVSFVQSFNPSLSASLESDTGEDLTSISKMLAATNTHNFQSLLEARLMNPPVTENQQISCSVEEPITDKYEDKALSLTPSPSHTPNSQRDVNLEEQIKTPTKQDDKKGVTEEEKKGRVRYKFVKKLSCPYCPRMFPWISSLRRHLLVHSGLKPYQCVNCTATFSTKSNCERHMVRKHNMTQDEATKLTTVNPFNCEVCSQVSFNRIDLLESHYEEKHSEHPLPAYFSRAKEVMQVPLEELMSKIKSKSDGSLQKKEQTGTNQIVGHNKSNEILQLCNGDGDLEELFQTTNVNAVTDVQEHEADMEYVEMSEDNAATRFEDENKAIEFDEKIGIDVHTEEQVDMGKDGEDSEIKSVTNEHLEDEPQQIIKSKKMNSSPLFNGRKRRKVSCTHICKQCKKKFKNSATLRRHYRVHTLEHPFKCSICCSSFTTKFNCQRHMIKIHGKQREDVFKVMELSETEQNELIKEATSQISAVNADDDINGNNDADSVHSSNDTDHTSSEKSFNSWVTKTSNSPGKQSSEDVRRKFSCDVCQKKFLSSRDLKRHDRTHTGERPFVCTDCNRNFGFKHSLVRHQRTHNHFNWTIQKSSEKFSSEVDANSIQDHSQDFDLSSLGTNDPSLHSQIEAYEDNLSNSKDMYIPSTLQRNNMLMQETSGNDCDLFEDGENLMSRITDCDIIQNLLGIQDSSMIDEMLDSADSAAKLLGVGEA